MTDARPKRGRCPDCGFSHRLRADGTLTKHAVWLGNEPRRCDGSYLPPTSKERS